MSEPATIRPVGTAAGAQLVEVADRAIVAGLDGRRPTVPDPSDLHPDLCQRLGAFVTLHVCGELNGCIGSIEGAETLGVAVARHAWSAAFADPRLPPLRPSDYRQLEIEVSVLSPLAPLPAESHTELIAALRPGVDGLLIGAGTRRGVFLPSVWNQLPSAESFVERLFLKAGLDPAIWSDDLRTHRFEAQTINRTRPIAEAS